MGGGAGQATLSYHNLFQVVGQNITTHPGKMCQNIATRAGKMSQEVGQNIATHAGNVSQVVGQNITTHPGKMCQVIGQIIATRAGNLSQAVGQDTATHASPTASNVFFPVHSLSFLFSKPSSDFLTKRAVDPRNKFGHPAHSHKRFKPVPVMIAYAEIINQLCLIIQ